MNADVQNRLILAAQRAAAALGGGQTDMDRLAAKNQIDAALQEVALDAEVRKQTDPEFDGPAYDPATDQDRLKNQLGRIFECMKDAAWRTLEEIHARTGDPVASISAQLRHLRKPRFGSYLVERRPRGDREHGLFEYRLLSSLGRVDRVVPDIADLKDVQSAEVL